MEYSFRSSTSLSSSFCSSWSESPDSGEYWPPTSELEEIPSRRWLPDTLPSAPSPRPRNLVAGAEKPGHASPPVARRNKYSPPEYRGILERAAVPVRFSTYEELHERLRREPILIDRGKKRFGLDKSTGKACYMLSADELQNKWGVFLHSGPDWMSLPKSRFPTVSRCRLDLYRPFGASVKGEGEGEEVELGEVELGEFEVEGEGEGEEVFVLLENGRRRRYAEPLSVAVEGVELRPTEQVVLW